MAENTDKKPEIAVKESQDGSATVTLPEDMLLGSEEGDENVEVTEQAEGGTVAEEDNDHPNDNDELRQAKRNRRRAKKDLIRTTNQEKDARLTALQRENEDFRRRLGQVERNTKAEHVTRIEKNIEDAQVRLEYAKMKLAEATDNNDGQAMVEAQTLWQSAHEDVRNLNYQHNQANQDLRQPQAEASTVDPEVQRMASKWVNTHKWYDPSGTDKDSRIAKKVDELMTTQGWNPSDSDYWEELDSRLQKELPHRYNDGSDRDVRSERRPRNIVGSAGRESSTSYGGSNRQVILSPERVRMMKESGAWENPVRKQKQIEAYIKYDRENGRHN